MMKKDDFSKLLKLLDIKFKDPKLLEQAFIHRSYLNEAKVDIPSNERLEFLGDSVLSLIISYYLFVARTKDTEGDLTNLRSYMVKTKSLSQVAKKLDLGGYLKLSRGEELGGGRDNPQLLANTYEALIGAIFIDLGLEKARKVIDQTLLPLFALELKGGAPADAKSRLQEIVQQQKKTSPRYKILKTFGPDHAKRFVVEVYVEGKRLGMGEGTNKQEAEVKAAREALGKLTTSTKLV